MNLEFSPEEIAFRGYIQQQLAARFKSPVIWMILPSVLFALGHYDPDETGSNALAIAALSGFFGLLLADLTARSGTLGPAIAMHLANNFVAMLLMSPQGSLTGLALFTSPIDLSDEALVRTWLPVDLATMLVSWLAARLVLRR